MSPAFYWTYSTRALRRGGQRTGLAVFCIAVGVMAIVALQLATLMVSNNLTGNVRAANGGDIAVTADVIPLQRSDLSYFASLRTSGMVTAFTALTRARGITAFGQHTYPTIIAVVDPAQYPLAGEPDFEAPANGDLHRLLAAPGTAVLSSAAATNLGVVVGDRVTVNAPDGRSLAVRVVGIVGGGGIAGGEDVYLQRVAYARSSTTPLVYNDVYITTRDDAQTNAVATAIKNRYPLATVRTVADALQAQQDKVTLVHQLLQVIGLLALLIGGFGVVNTMNVMLARRRVEIAMLKATGYVRRDLYLLFGMEAGVLGIAGGISGALAGVALSWGVKTLIERAFLLRLPFTVDALSVVMGVAVGFCTAVIFGLLPIVRAAAVRPQAVLRDVAEQRQWSARVNSVGLIALLAVLFWLLSSLILGSAVWGLGVVLGTFVILGLLSLVFGGVVVLVSKLPVPERLTPGHAALATVALIIAVAVVLLLPPVGALLVVAALLGYGVAFLPRPWKGAIKMSLRDIGRQRTRATMTLLALFVGVFSVGLIVILGQDVRDKLSSALANLSDYNVASVVPARYAGTVDRELAHLRGLQKYQIVNAAQAVPVAVNGRALKDLLLEARPRRRRGPFAQGDLGRNGTQSLLSGFGGYDLGRQSTAAKIAPGNGRDLVAADTGTHNVLLNSLLHTLGPLHLKLGARITVKPYFSLRTLTVTVVGFYTQGFDTTHFEPILAPRALVHRFGAGSELYIYNIKVDPHEADAAVAELNHHTRAITINITSLFAIVDQVLGNLVILLVALASLALFAGIVIIANAVALAMLERRREQGILKSVGYTSGRVLASVLVENGVIGGLGGLLGMTVVAIATTVLANTLFNTTLAIPGSTTLALILAVTAIAVVTAVLVAWRAVRVRPVEVLRYE